MPGGNKSTQTSSNQPYEALQPILNAGLGDALDLYKNGGFSKAGTVSTVVPMSGDTTRSLDMLRGVADAGQANSPLKNWGALQNTYANGGYNPAQQTAVSALTPTARGDYLTRTDPNFEKVLKTARDNATTDTNAAFAGMGRFGGASNAGALGDALGNVESSARLAQYNTERDRQTQAASSLFGMGQQGYQNVADSGNVFQSILGGAAAPADIYGQTGQRVEDQAAADINERLRQANLPVTALQQLLGLGSGISGYGTTTAQTKGPSNTLSNILGGGLLGASLLGV